MLLNSVMYKPSGLAILSLSLVMAYGVYSYSSFSEVLESAHQSSQTNEELAKLSEIENFVIDLETGLRGYIITGQKTFLSPYFRAEKALADELLGLKLRVNIHSALIAKLEDIEKTIKKWNKSWAVPLIAIREKSSIASEINSKINDFVRAAKGKQQLDKVRGYLTELQQMLTVAKNDKGKYQTLAISKNMADMETGLRGFLITGDERFLQPYFNGKQQITDNIEQLHGVIDRAYERHQMRKDINQLRTKVVIWREQVATPIIHKSNSGNLTKTHQDLDEKGKQIMDEIRSLTGDIHQRFSKANNYQAANMILAVLQDMIDFETGLRGYVLTRKKEFLQPFYQAEKRLHDHLDDLTSFTTNDFPVAKTRRLAANILNSSNKWQEEVADYLIDLQRKKNQLPYGNVEVIRKVSSAKGKEMMDKVRDDIQSVRAGLLLEVDRNEQNLMQTTRVSRVDNMIGVVIIAILLILAFFVLQRLRKNSEDLEKEKIKLQRQAWIRDNVTKIQTTLSEVYSENEFAELLLKMLVEMLEAQLGVFFQASSHSDDHKHKEEHLFLLHSLAYKQRKNLSNHFKLGEGLVGQSALEKKAIYISEIPDDYICISSGLGEAKPKYVVVFPIVFENKVGAVIEIASMTPFNTSKQELLSVLERNLGQLFNNILSRQHTEKLLQKSQHQAEVLQTQQEELQAANETLEEQTLQLKASEEELNASNVELKKRQDILEVQKQELQKIKLDLEEKARNLNLASKYKTEFLANMSHELRTPLNSMLILSKMLLDNSEGNLSEKQLEDIAMINDGGKDLLELINDIMDLSKVEAGMLDIHKEVVELAVLENSMRKLFLHFGKEKDVNFECELSGNLPSSIISDEQRIEQVLKNFLSNAFKFTRKGGTVKLEFHGTRDDLPAPRRLKEQFIGISVVDSGIGIAKEKQQSIFESFQQEDGSTSRKYGGTGLGLSISKELAHILGGEITLKSEQGVGSTFTLYLPLELPEVTKVAIDSTVPNEMALDTSMSPVDEKEKPLKKDKKKEKPSSNNIKDIALASQQQFIADDRNLLMPDEAVILIVEDDPIFAKILLDIVRKNHQKVLVTNLGRDGLYLAMEYKPKGVLLDLGLPDIDGTEVLEQLKYHLDTRDIPVYILSGNEQEKKKALSEGAVHFLTKPVSAEAVESILEKLTSQQTEPQSVLLIEDDEKTQMAVIQLLKGKNLEVSSVSLASDAFDLLKQQKFDCIILDLTLPDMDGNEVLEKLAHIEEYQEIPVIVYTGREISDKEQQLLSQFSDDIIIKGAASPERLLDDISLFLHQLVVKEQQKMISTRHDENAMLKDRRLLLVDDDMRNTFALSRQLGEFGMDVEIAGNGKQALESLESSIKDEEKPYELIFMDIMMPEMDGYEAMGHIRKMSDYKDIPIIALTAKVMKEERQKCLDAGASEYLTKPIEIDRLVSMLRIWLYKSRN